MRRKVVGSFAAVAVGIVVALSAASPALAADSASGYRSCPGGTGLVGLRSESVGTDYHRIGTATWNWPGSGYHQSYSSSGAANWAADTSGGWTLQPTSFCY